MIGSRMVPLTSWKRLVRYVSAQDGIVRYGEPITDLPTTNIDELANTGTLEVEILEGLDFVSAKPTGRRDQVKQLLGPLKPSDVPVIRCIGLNYKSHIIETCRPLPKAPTVFMKPAPAIAGNGDDITVPRFAQDQLDYEGELVVVIGEQARDISEADALDHVAAYTSGNDVSARDWQREPDKAGTVPQWCYGKSFDQFAPVGPCLVSPEVLGAADNLALQVRVNGDVRQNTNTSDLLFGVKSLVAFCARGQTLQKGSLIMTGTCGGVGLFMKPPQFLQHGDIVSVYIEGIGSVENRFNFL